jgi:hypothetical protein
MCALIDWVYQGCLLFERHQRRNHVTVVMLYGGVLCHWNTSSDGDPD